jgi:hypothetical protein
MQDDIPFFITKHSYILCTSLINFVLKLGHKSFTFADIFRLHVNWIHSQCPPTELHLSFRSHAFLCFCCQHCSDTCSLPQRVQWNNMKMWIGVQRIYIADCLTSLIYENFSQLYCHSLTEKLLFSGIGWMDGWMDAGLWIWIRMNPH